MTGSLSGLTRREISRRLREKGSVVDVTRILRGDIELKLWHLLAILSIMEVEALEFFQMVFPAPSEPRSPLLHLLEKALDDNSLMPPRVIREPSVAFGERARRRLKKLVGELERLIVEAETPDDR